MVEVFLQSLGHFTPHPSFVQASEKKPHKPKKKNTHHFKRPKSNNEFNPKRAENKTVT